jgi:hypothetical protein
MENEKRKSLVDTKFNFIEQNKVFVQGMLTKGEGSVPLTPSFR